MRKFKTGQRLKVDRKKLLQYCKQKLWHQDFDNYIIVSEFVTSGSNLDNEDIPDYYYNGYYYPEDCLYEDRALKLKRLLK